LDQPLHKLAGSAGAYGFVRLGEAARQADGLIADALAASTDSATAASAPLRQLGSVLREIDELFDSEIGGSSAADNAGGCVASTSGLQVLLVDDDVELAAVLCEQLCREGIQVSVVHDGAAMHRALAATRPDVLLLDYWLQAETGAELASSVHALADYANLPTLCLTTDHSDHTRQCALAAGVLAVVDKALPSAELARKLRQLAQRAA
jgi:CheY-like chemotaxis protein